ncbi:hypothetical protein EHI8A_011270 [Entamoeba histolytica HM-1:IMSS-B]|uniref:Uncharacterized protein n=8 Tax=Entamoeba TaxID=5758 RepID=C4M152_ENTH1|nr:hypothetical protein ENU1_150140 [Entamoeba nuttalli P19]XP_650668.1 hypothetical protein EHI_107110 [Entamoeba histolytica HM-1:IMSS]EMD45596.1 Hypothetical protein EHI5A_009840 [Entamoeba histolytica KU27]EMH76309.1 hypothetical protein EHI8A_011270 [Entamoeba histolytica HM-1:IMSS-B]EMS12559.1 hypothetical protein KM1_009750 [Entamoeba histolytica HM-3:IMSS]ENY62333.1 hypothetical protein EHI7A_019680 [Entamoeba histolytica HM-1:IMSS-A]GAT94925.1 hypothetical protein CL6EHI_107110 [Enta|eukprot:XP_008858809.1 hypothetical protein ENU1_150140 [Entamoeba nuttalli P19]
MISETIIALIIIGCTANKERIIYKDGVFSNGYQAKESTGYISTTAEYHDQIVISIILSKNNYINFKTNSVTDLSPYKYLSFVVSWEQEGVNLGLAVSIGNDDSMKPIQVTSGMAVNRLNRVYVDISSLTANSTKDSLVRIFKTDKTDSTIYFNDIKFTEEKGTEGIYSFSTDMDETDGTKTCFIVLFIALLFMAL